MRPKARGKGLEMRTITANDGHTYLVFRTLDGSYHVFREVDARNAARESFGQTTGNTRKMWGSIWSEHET
jgi:hypothetical protein